ncbi:uncharacterized protein TRAVEDRAFT_49103 [Trametes versicolor FP-101664 SS1]|uniref:uncharacterized protein n=1 Tax=Trametes versicolor (strain FP-101664) TaxID=717944 RepID=UPI0004621E4B|nr:uncharacterized protein TRAVEDRAFT_49103 [Trametes versicolor FP-101664 SS1]EIW56264.1 hypothetical protein TRAVEDRAFT_49103 [Trametes versicolor FP-101664 SS1]
MSSPGAESKPVRSFSQPSPPPLLAAGMAVWTTWVVLFKPYAADAYNFIAREQYHSDSTDTGISSAIDALSKRQSVARCLDGRSWSYKIYELPERPTAARANAKLKTAYEEHITTKYLDDLEPIDGSEPINEVGKPDNLVLIIYPDYDMSEPQHRPSIRRLSSFKPFRDVSCCPCLLVTIAGPNIMVGGAVYAEQIIATSFTSYISIAPLDVPGPRPMYDAAIWRAARLMRALDAHYAAVTQALNAARSADRLPTCYVGPHLTHVSADGTAASLNYTGRLCTGEPAKTLYAARARITSDSEQDPRETVVVVKFTKAYSAEGHRLLAVHGLAPKLWFCEWVESVDMYVVVMDHVRDAETADEDVAMSVADAAAVQMAVELLHAAGLVFGDLRGQNVWMRKDGERLLIDFDWCGPEGTACYPLGVNMHSAIPWHPDVNTGTLIKKEHDWHLLKVLTGS